MKKFNKNFYKKVCYFYKILYNFNIKKLNNINYSSYP